METKADEETDKPARPAPIICSCRLTLFIMFMLATTIFMLQRLNINFSLVCMVRRSQPNQTHHVDLMKMNDNQSVFGLKSSVQEEECIFEEQAWNENATDTGEFEWSKETQGTILASFFYGFVFTQIPGGWICDRFGAKNAFIVTAAALSALTVLNPLAAWQGPEYLFGLRLLMGVSHGAAIPAINVLSTRWCAASERAFLLGIAYSGFAIASAITYPISATLCQWLGWPYIFYVTGTVGLIWSLFAIWTVYDWPEDHPRMDDRELAHLKQNRAVHYGEKAKKLQVPWKKMLMSRPIIVLLIANFSVFWTFHTIVMYLPTFLKEVLRMDIKNNGFYSALPYIMMLSVHFAVGKLFDVIRQKNLCSLTILRRIFNTAGTLGPALFLALMGVLSCHNQFGAILVISLGQTMQEFAFMGGYLFSVFEMAPRYAGIVTGVSNTFGLLTGFLCPAVVSYMTTNATREEWLSVFYLAAAVSSFGGIVYLLWGSSDLLPWAASPKTVKETELKTIEKESLMGTTGLKLNGNDNLPVQPDQSAA